MIRIYLTILLLNISGSAVSDDTNFLIGSWVSDKEATISYHRENANWSEEQYKLFENIIGNLSVVFTGTTSEWSYEEDSGENKYEVINRSRDTIIIKPELNKEDLENLNLGVTSSEIKYFRDGNKIYTEPKWSKSLLREYFKRVD